MDDNLCFCGLASIQLMSPDHSLREEDIKHINFENEVKPYYCNEDLTHSSYHATVFQVSLLALCGSCYEGSCGVCERDPVI